MKKITDYKIYPLGETALTIDFGNEISVEINDFVINLSLNFEQNIFAGFIECVPAYSTLTIFYDVISVKISFPDFTTAFDAIKSIVKDRLENLSDFKEIKSKTIEIPTSFEGSFAPDLEFVAESNNLEPAEVIEIFLSKTYRVFMLGFLPGFAYMGELDKRIAAPRKQTPRTKVPKGSVGIAGTQTGIYPLESPGGWQIIGNTEIELFTPKKNTPTLLQTGDQIKFTRIK